MSPPHDTLVLASGVQGGGAHPPQPHGLLLVCGLLVTLTLLTLAVAWFLRRRRRAKPVADQWGALAVMGELCPHGWQAQITLYGWGAPIPDDAPPSRVPLVELEWKQFDEQPGQIAVARRAWAPTIPEALQAMVEDRQTDLTLEQIEQSAGGEDLWSV
ncbi:MAG TPA: hypothetical protein VH061_01850 [Solirubrobacteraceae bacterium]|nr:hypothetical protein [Solirubrobacteraceae bacterium]